MPVQLGINLRDQRMFQSAFIRRALPKRLRAGRREMYLDFSRMDFKI